MNKDSHLIYEGYKRGRKIQRLLAVDFNGNKVCFRVGDFIKILNDDLSYKNIGKIARIMSIAPYEGMLTHNPFLLYFDSASGIIDSKYGYPPNFVILYNPLNKIDPKHREDAASLLDI